MNERRERRLGWLGRFRLANVERCETVFHPVDDWSETDWATALAGEVGELLNLIKKRRRGQDIPLRELESEVGDIVAYLDLLCARLGVDIAKATIQKFNQVSSRPMFDWPHFVDLDAERYEPATDGD